MNIGGGTRFLLKRDFGTRFVCSGLSHVHRERGFLVRFACLGLDAIRECKLFYSFCFFILHNKCLRDNVYVDAVVRERGEIILVDRCGVRLEKIERTPSVVKSRGQLEYYVRASEKEKKENLEWAYGTKNTRARSTAVPLRVVFQ